MLSLASHSLKGCQEQERWKSLLSQMIHAMELGVNQVSPARVHLSGRSHAEQLLQRGLPWVDIVLLLNLFCIDMLSGCRTPLSRAVVAGRSAHCCCSFCAGSQGGLSSPLSSSGMPWGSWLSSCPSRPVHYWVASVAAPTDELRVPLPCGQGLNEEQDLSGSGPTVAGGPWAEVRVGPWVPSAKQGGG